METIISEKPQASWQHDNKFPQNAHTQILSYVGRTDANQTITVPLEHPLPHYCTNN